MTIEMWPLGRIVPYAKNARKIPQRAIDKVAASLREFGWQQPIVVDTAGVIVVGHTRLLAARQLGWLEAPVHVADKLTPAQIAAYRLMDNRSHEESGWNLELLGPELIDLKAMNFELSLTGFELRELGKLIPEAHDEPEAHEHHPTQKPVELAARAIRNSSKEGEIVLDLFAGSGSTMVAAQNLNRRCYGLEIEPKYCAVILERMTAMGLTPVCFQPIKEKHAARRSKQVQAI